MKPRVINSPYRELNVFSGLARFAIIAKILNQTDIDWAQSHIHFHHAVRSLSNFMFEKLIDALEGDSRQHQDARYLLRLRLSEPKITIEAYDAFWKEASIVGDCPSHPSMSESDVFTAWNAHWSFRHFLRDLKNGLPPKIKPENDQAA